MRVEDEYVKTGFFWLPERNENKIPGILTIKNGGDIELEVFGVFGDSYRSFIRGGDLKRVIGQVETEGFVTLENCFYTSNKICSNGTSKSKFHVDKVLSGAAYDKNEALTFNTLSFSVDCLDAWVRISGIQVDSDLESKTYTINYTPLENISYMLDGGTKLDICFEYKLTRSSSNTESMIRQRGHFRLSSDDLRPLRELTDIAHKLTNFLCFAIDTTVSLKELSATSKEMLQDGIGGKKEPIPVKIFYPSIPFTKMPPEQSWPRMLFTYETIKSDAQNVFNNWLGAYEVIAPALNLYFSTKNDAHRYLSGKFLALAQGLETYHRRTTDEKVMASCDFDAVVSSLNENCPEKYAGWLSGRLKHGNEINLGKRLKQIIEPFKDKLGSSSERSKLIRKIVITRNYLTHYDDILTAEVANRRELWNLCQKMELIFQLHFLKVIGFSDEEIESVVENCYPLRQKINIAVTK